MLYTKSIKFLSLIVIVCQVAVMGNLLYTDKAWAQETETPSEQPAETPADETPAETPADTPADSGEAEPEITNTLPVEPEPETTTDPIDETIIDNSEVPPVDATEDADSADNAEALELLTGENNTGENTDTADETPDNTDGVPLVYEEENPPVFVIGGDDTSSYTDESADSADENSDTVNSGSTVDEENSDPINLKMEGVPLVGPRILASWTMGAGKDENFEYMGTDDDSAAGAQFLPSGQYELDKKTAVCAVVINGSGPENLAGVTANVAWPLSADALELKPQVDSLSLTGLDRSAGVSLVCDKIKNNNNNLIQFSSGLSYDHLCGPDSYLRQGRELVYCAEQTLTYNQIAGDYGVNISAVDTDGEVSPDWTASFKYLELTAYAVDFDNIGYGAVQPHTPKIISGDAIWDEPVGPNLATIRNAGNTSMRLVVTQNDFGLGKSGESWNVGYQARIGDTAWVSYGPDQPAALAKIMEPGETNALDFQIEVYAFPTETNADYSGEMWLTAERAE